MVWYRYFGLSFIVLPLSYIINKFSYSISIVKCTWCKVCQFKLLNFRYFLVKFTRLWNWRWPHYLSWKVFRKLFLKIETLTLVWIELPLRLFFLLFSTALCRWKRKRIQGRNIYSVSFRFSSRCSHEGEHNLCSRYWEPCHQKGKLKKQNFYTLTHRIFYHSLIWIAIDPYDLYFSLL